MKRKTYFTSSSVIFETPVPEATLMTSSRSMLATS